jgi:polyadenylation factor subunit 2
MAWNHAGDFMLTGDRNGNVRYYPNSLRIHDEFSAHDEAVRGISFSPSDSRFCTGSDDGTVCVWDCWEIRRERKMDTQLKGHGGQVNAVAWHPHMGLIASGSRDNLCLLWDPKAGKRVFTMYVRLYFSACPSLRTPQTLRARRSGHKNEVQQVAWNPCNPNWLVTASRDQVCDRCGAVISCRLYPFPPPSPP